MADAQSKPLPVLSIPTSSIQNDGIGTYRHLPRIREGVIRFRRTKLANRERIEIRKGQGKQPWHYVHIASNNEILTWSEKLTNHKDAVTQGQRLADRLSIPLVDEHAK